MLFPRAIHAIGLSARPLRPSLSTASTPRFLPAALPTARLQPPPTRLYSSDAESPLPPTISPPWQINDLTSSEQEAYAKHGAGYLEHLTAAQKRQALRMADLRRKTAEQAAARLGPDWYAIFREADERADVICAGKNAEFARRRSLLGPVVNPKKPPPEHRQLYAALDAWNKERRDLKKEIREKIVEERRLRAEGKSAPEA